MYLKQIIMKSLQECCATPMNTSGIGNPSAPEGDNTGSGDIPIGTVINKKNKKKLRHLKDFVKK